MSRKLKNILITGGAGFIGVIIKSCGLAKIA